MLKKTHMYKLKKMRKLKSLKKHEIRKLRFPYSQKSKKKYKPLTVSICIPSSVMITTEAILNSQMN